MTVEELLIEAKKKVHSDYAKMVMADMLNINSLELFNYLNDQKDEEFCNKVLSEFGATGEYAHIINGHMPVKVIDGETLLVVMVNILLLMVVYQKLIINIQA